MRRLFPGIALALSIAAGCADGGMEIPTVELGSDGARLMNGSSRSPVEAYEKAYSNLGRAHYNVRRNLEPRGQNEFGAREAMGNIIRCLDVMRACVPNAGQAKFDPYLARYRDWLKSLEDGTWGGSFLTEFDRTEREVKTAFSPSETEILAEFPKAATTAKPAGSELTPDKVEVPTARPSAPPPPTAPKPAEPVKAKPEPEPASPAASRVLYKAWNSAHDELVAAYKDKKPCKPKYDELLESLKLFKAQLPADKASKLQIYIEFYGDIDEKTKGFTVLPEKTTEKDVVDELEVAARMIRKAFNPEK
jgi:hypothetical protein